VKTLSSHKLFSSPSGLSVSFSLRVGCDAAGSDRELEDVADVHSNDDSKLLCDQRYKLLHFEKAVVSSVSTCTHSKSSNNECQSTTSNSNYDHYSLPFFYYDLKGCAQAITPVYAASVRLSAFKKLTGIGNNAYMHRGEGLGGKGNVLCIGHV
jgi:hypothetical protein